MSYIVNKTDGSVLTTLLDGTTNTQTGLTLIGRNFTSYGEIQNENFVRLLENFASNLPPGQSVGFAPIAGQLWWNTADQRLQVYNGAQFITVSEQTASATVPSNSKLGDQWWDTTDQQLKVYNGSTFTVINPPFTASQGKTGALVETVTDGNLATHLVVNTYVGNQLISVTSADAPFQTGAYAQFSTIRPGVNLASNVTFNGTVINSLQLGGSFANAYPRTDRRTDFVSDLGVGGNLVIGNANVFYSSNTLVITNSVQGGGIDLYVNAFAGNTRAVRVSGTTGLLTVAANPTDNLGIATKGYIDSIQLALNNSLVANVVNIDANVSQLRSDTFSALTSNVAAINNQFQQFQTTTNANVSALNSAFENNVTSTDANLANKTSRIASLEADIVLKSTINSPAFTGTPTVPTPAANNNSTRIATTAYVDASDSLINSYINSQISSALALTANNLALGLAPKANSVAPAFSGTATSETPTPTDNSTKIATTAFVRGAITGDLARWQGSRYTVSAAGPTGGDDGDFWFQVS